MKKEVVIAIVFGVGLGLVVAFFLVSRIKEMDSSKVIAIQPSPSTAAQPSISVSNTDDHTLTVSSPVSNTVVNKNVLTITGKAQKNSLLVIQSSLKDSVAKQTKDDFSVDVPLSKGENVITITAYPQDKQLRTQQKILRIYNVDEQ